MSAETEIVRLRQYVEGHDLSPNNGENVVTSIIRMNQTLAREVEALRAGKGELIEVLRLTVEYIGNDLLPAELGWSWYDVLTRHAPAIAEEFRLHPVKAGLGGSAVTVIRLQAEINRLAAYITENVDAEPSRSEGAVDTAIRVMEQSRRWQEANSEDHEVQSGDGNPVDTDPTWSEPISITVEEVEEPTPLEPVQMQRLAACMAARQTLQATGFASTSAVDVFEVIQLAAFILTGAEQQ